MKESIWNLFGNSIYNNPYYEDARFQWTFGLFYDHITVPAREIWFWIKNCRRYIVKTDCYGWHDSDEIMFRACFSILGKFVNQELRKARTDDAYQYRGFRMDSKKNDKAIDLWLWYRNELPDLYKVEKQMPYVKWRANAGDNSEDIKTRKLQELIDIRESLWT